jgi:hypothetical protein
LRAAGLAESLEAAGIAAFDAGDLPVSLFATTAAPSGARNRPAVLEVADRVAVAVAAARAHGDIAVLLGGDCTLVLGAVAGLRRHEQAATRWASSTSTATRTWTHRRRGGGSWTAAWSPTCSATAIPSWPPCGQTDHCSTPHHWSCSASTRRSFHPTSGGASPVMASTASGQRYATRNRRKPRHPVPDAAAEQACPAGRLDVLPMDVGDGDTADGLNDLACPLYVRAARHPAG